MIQGILHSITSSIIFLFTLLCVICLDLICICIVKRINKFDLKFDLIFNLMFF